MFFITNRAPSGSARTKKGREFNFALNQNSPSNSVYYCERSGEEQYKEIGSAALMEGLKTSSAKQLLFFLHGFSNLPEPDIFPRATKLQAYLDAKDPNGFLVIPLIWPCDDDFGMVKDYWDDQKSADISGYSFARVMQRFMSWRQMLPEEAPCLKRINVLAHSMGNRVLRETLARWNQYDLADGVPLLFRNTILMAADIVNESLEEGQPGRLISEASRNVSVYFASDDLALRASKGSNLKNKIASRRLGHTGPENMRKVATNVYAIDCDNFNNSYDRPKGHSYFLDDKDGKAGKVFEHMYVTLTNGRVEVEDKERRTTIL
jgi:esterase/lipase superfamily enzyme